MKKLSDLEFYSLAEAKKNFSNVINLSEKNEVVITKNGKPVSVIIDYKKFVSLMDFISGVWELYLVDIGQKEGFGKLSSVSIEDLFIDTEEKNQEV